MKVISVNINGTIIKFSNCNWTGYEYVYVNGKMVSKKFSWFGTDHIFDVEEDGEWVEYIMRFTYGYRGLSADVTRNGIRIISRGKGDIDLLPSRSSKRLYSENDLVGGF